MTRQPHHDAADSQLFHALRRVHKVALLSSADYADLAALLCDCLIARGCDLVAGIEGPSAAPDVMPTASLRATPSESQFDVVLILGSSPLSSEAWLLPGPLQSAARAAVRAVSAKVPLFHLCDGDQRAALLRDVNKLSLLPPQDSAGAKEARWQAAASAAAVGDVNTLAQQLAGAPELRAACDSSTGRTLMHVAALARAPSAVSFLLQSGSKWQARDTLGRTAGDASFLGGSQLCFDELVARAAAETQAQPQEEVEQDEEGSERKPKRVRKGHDDYLVQTLQYDGERLLDGSGKGVMMGWEAPLMQKHAEVLLPTPGGAVLNVGFGLGLVDGYLQSRQPKAHTIIEAHPDVLAELTRRGWTEKEGVRIRAGRWQDVVGDLPAGSFDAIYWDTWQESYIDLREFIGHVPRLLKPGGRFSFFNGMAPYSIFEHAVFTRLAQEDLLGQGLQCDVLPVKLGELDERVWDGVEHRYWQFEIYYLPLAVKAQASAMPSQCAQPRSSSCWRCWPESAIRVSDEVGPRCFEDLALWPKGPAAAEKSTAQEAHAAELGAAKSVSPAQQECSGDHGLSRWS